MSSGRTDHPWVLGAASGKLYRIGMSSFDYSAPAELFLFKPRRVAAPNIVGSRQRLRPSVMPLRTCAHPKHSARTWRLGMSALTAAKSNVSMKPRTIRCASLSDRRLASRAQAL